HMKQTKQQTEKREPKNREDRGHLLDAITDRTKAVALITLIAEALFLSGAIFLPTEQRIWAFCVSALVLFIAMAGSFAIEFAEARHAARALPLPPSQIEPRTPTKPETKPDMAAFDTDDEYRPQPQEERFLNVLPPDRQKALTGKWTGHRIQEIAS